MTGGRNISHLWKQRLKYVTIKYVIKIKINYIEIVEKFPLYSVNYFISMKNFILY